MSVLGGGFFTTCLNKRSLSSNSGKMVVGGIGSPLCWSAGFLNQVSFLCPNSSVCCVAGSMSLDLETLKPSKFKIPEERFRLGVRKGNLTVRDYGMGCVAELLSPVTCQAEAGWPAGIGKFSGKALAAAGTTCHEDLCFIIPQSSSDCPSAWHLEQRIIWLLTNSI